MRAARIAWLRNTRTCSPKCGARFTLFVKPSLAGAMTPMIIKSNRHRNGRKLAAYLLSGGKHGERVSAPELYGFAADNIFDALQDVHAAAAVRAIESPLLHIQVRLPDAERMTANQWDETTRRILARLDLSDQPYARVFHGVG